MKTIRTLYSLTTMAPAGKAVRDTTTGETTIELRCDVAVGEKLVIEPDGPVTWWPDDFGGDVLLVYPAEPGETLPPYLPRVVEAHEILPYGAEHKEDVAARVARELARYRSVMGDYFAIGVWDARADRMVWHARTWDPPPLVGGSLAFAAVVAPRMDTNLSYRPSQELVARLRELVTRPHAAVRDCRHAPLLHGPVEPVVTVCPDCGMLFTVQRVAAHPARVAPTHTDATFLSQVGANGWPGRDPDWLFLEAEQVFRAAGESRGPVDPSHPA